MLRKILKKDFITKKCTQCTPHFLKIDVFELPDNRNIGKLFSKYKLLLRNQANSSSDPSQILVLQHPNPISSLPPSPSLANFALETENLLKQSSSCSSLVSLSLPTQFNHTPQVLDIQKHVPSHANQIYYHAYTDHKTLHRSNKYPSKSWVLKSPFPFKVSRQHLDLRYKVCWIFHKMVNLPVHTTIRTISTKNSFIHFS